MPGVATLNAVPGLGSFSLLGRNRVHGPALTLAREHEALVALLGDLIALPAVPADAFRAEVGQEAARLPGDVGSHVPGIGARHQARVHDLGDMPHASCACGIASIVASLVLRMWAMHSVKSKKVT